ncbi:MAG: YpdA family putative bacillithiol disulfide reductase [Gemmatimonadetes bacterium]|nr:YpdA family putative bacillithiol disulfide reductase [Gemmatimonadota bacterium]
MSRTNGTEILVVGAGPCGMAVGAAARRAGVNCILLDKGPIVSSIERYPIGMNFFSTADHLEIENVPFVVARDNPTRSEALKYYRRVATHFDLDVRQYETVDAVERSNGSFEVHSRHLTGVARSYRADAVVVATGYFDTPKLLGVPGEELPKVTHYFRDPHPYFNQDVLVVGGGNSAVEAALTTWRAGARVTLVHLFEGFDRGVKPWVLPDIRNRIEAREISAFWKHEVERIDPDRVLLRDLEGGSETWLANDFVLAMTGFRPDPVLLSSLGVPLNEETGIPGHDPASMETDVPGVYIAGVLAAGFDANKIFIQNGREHGQKIVRRFAASRAETPGR